MMVECEHGMEERSLGGSINLARTPAQTSDAAQGSSYFNRQEAILAVRHVPLSDELTAAMIDVTRQPFAQEVAPTCHSILPPIISFLGGQTELPRA